MKRTFIGQSIYRNGFKEKLTGTAKFTADIYPPNMLYTKILRSPYAHAKILAIDTTQAEQMPGVKAILTPFHVGASVLIGPDMPILDTTVRFVGDEVMAIAAEDEESADLAIRKVKVKYSILPFVLDAEDALLDAAPKIHKSGNLWGATPIVLERGDINSGFETAEKIYSERYRVESHSGAALEPRISIAHWTSKGLTVWKTSRGIHQDRDSIAKAFDLPPKKVTVICNALGAGYGNKDEGRSAYIASMLSEIAGHPVRVEYSRKEEFIAGRVRHQSIIDLKIGVKMDGTISAIHTKVIANTGAYLASGAGVIRRAGQGPIYLYNCPNVKYEGYLVYTNSPVAGSYRGLGAPQGHFALESMIDKISDDLGIDPLDFRMNNKVEATGQPGSRISDRNTPVDPQPVEGGIPFSSYGLTSCLDIGSRLISWRHKKRFSKSAPTGHLRGTGMAMCLYRGGPGQPSKIVMRLFPDRLEIITGILDVGQGIYTILIQFAAEIFRCDPELVTIHAGDSSSTPESPLTAGSTATFSTGLALQEAANKLKEQLFGLSRELLDIQYKDLDLRNFSIFSKVDPRQAMSIHQMFSHLNITFLETTVTSKPSSTTHIVNSFAAHFAQLDIDISTGSIKLMRYVAVHDSGTIINHNMAVNQVEGGVNQMLGLALQEEVILDPKTGMTLNASFLEHKSFLINDYQQVETEFVQTHDPVGPFGAKALGEPPSVPVLAVIANALYDATGIRFTKVPITRANLLIRLTQIDKYEPI